MPRRADPLRRRAPRDHPQPGRQAGRKTSALAAVLAMLSVSGSGLAEGWASFGSVDRRGGEYSLCRSDLLPVGQTR